MKLINDLPYVNLEPFLDMEGFDNIHENIIRSLAKNSNHIDTSSTVYNTLFDKSNPGFFEQMAVNASKNPNMKNRELQLYTKLSGTVTLGHHLVVRSHHNYPTSYFFKHLDKDSVNFSCYNDFDFLFKWLEDQKCFTEFGRVLFWFNEPGQQGALHRDYVPAITDKKDMFIWLTGVFPKKMIVYDDQTEEKIIIPHRAIVFNTLNWHASIGHQNLASWSLRIDGLFNPEWAEKAGIKDYYNL